MKKILAILAALLIAAAAYIIGQRAGFSAGIAHVMNDCDAWLDYDDGWTGWAIIKLDGTEYKIAVF